MTLATVLDGQPMTRIVLLKGLDDRGFVWFTNYLSQKGRALADEPRAGAELLLGQVRALGECHGHTVERVSDEESNVYFASLPPGSRIGES